MKFQEAINELEDIAKQVRKLRVRARYAPWFSNILKGVEQLLKSLADTLDKIERAGK